MAADPISGKPVLARDAYNIVLIGSSWVAWPIVQFYEWNGFGWNMRYPMTSPGLIGAMASDVARGRIVALDGELPGLTTPGSAQPFHTWTYSNGDCARLQPSVAPSPRRGAAMAFDTQRGVTVMYGGYNSIWSSDTWEFDLGPLASFTTYGTGCTGARGVPQLTAQPNSLPRIGQTFTTRVSNLPWTGLALMLLGESDTTYGTAPLPVDLGFLNAPNCLLRTSIDDLQPLQNVLGTATWSFTIPPVPGAVFFLQAVPFDATANGLGLTFSNGGRAVVGL